ncbi:hypothetical protein C0J52_26504 [Blattella germanica]|nr:hypothetical protein C0J52_26504 [Blattella germanica]
MPCTPNYCDTFAADCSQIQNAPPCSEEQYFSYRGSTCGCCDICKPALGEGETCDYLGIVAARPPRVPLCKQGLVCSQNNVCVAL